MALFNVNGASLSSLQTWVVIIIASGSLGISVFRENKAVTNIQDTRDKVIEVHTEQQYIKEKLADLEADNERHDGEYESLMSEIEGLRIHQDGTDLHIQEMIDIGRYYVENQEDLTHEQIKGEIEDWVKKNDWIEPEEPTLFGPYD